MCQATAIASIPNLIGLGLGLYKAKTLMTLVYSISVYLRGNRVLMPSELSESSPDQAGSIHPPFNSRPLCDLLSPPIGPAPGLQMA